MWNLVHNGIYHNECIYRKWKHDQKLQQSQNQTSTQIVDTHVDIEGVDENDEENSADENESEESNELIDDSANLRMFEKKKGTLFNRYELADLLIKSQSENGNFKWVKFRDHLFFTCIFFRSLWHIF